MSLSKLKKIEMTLTMQQPSLNSYAVLKTVSSKLVSTSLAICSNLTKDTSPHTINTHQCMDKEHIYPSITSFFFQRTVCGKKSPPITYRHYHQPRGCGCWWCGCMRGCVYDGITRWGWGRCWSVEGCCCPLAPPVQGFPSLTNTGTATRRGDGRVVTPAPPCGPWGSWRPFSCCALFVLYRWFWNQIFTCGDQRENLKQTCWAGTRCGKH